MPHPTSHAPGTVSWADVATPDVAVASAFYGELLGWDVDEPDPEMGGYANASVDGRRVAGLMPIVQEGQPTAWTVYLATDDADRTAEAVTAGGGHLVVPPMDVADLGRMAVATDPAGGFFGLWQPGTHTGFELTEAPGGPGWFELCSADHHRANAFYTGLFDLGVDQAGDGDTVDYTVLTHGGRMVAGTTTLPTDHPERAGWQVYFIVTDADAVVASATRLGGTVLSPAVDSPFGRMAELADPFGARFAVITMMDGPSDGSVSGSMGS